MTGATATESTRDQIIHAAADSLLENGYSGTSVRSIASKAGVAIGNLQYWFPTKSELLVEAWRYLTAKSVEELRTRARFIKISSAGLRESHVHDVIITKEAPNYRMERD